MKFVPICQLSFVLFRQIIIVTLKQAHSLFAPSGTLRNKITGPLPSLAVKATSGAYSSPQEVLSECVTTRSTPADQVIRELQKLDNATDPPKILPSNVVGKFELVFSSGVANLPLVGRILNGYLPNKEIIEFNPEEGFVTLDVETLPFVPTISIKGNNLQWNQESAVLSYIIEGNDKRSEWKVLYADDSMVAAKSSVTGLNIIKRI